MIIWIVVFTIMFIVMILLTIANIKQINKKDLSTSQIKITDDHPKQTDNSTSKKYPFKL